MEDYYAILEVHPKASPEVIKKAYLVLSKKYHPDTTSLPRDEAEKQMALLNKAYYVLSDPDKRMEYDRMVMGEEKDKERTQENQQFSSSQTTRSSRYKIGFAGAALFIIICIVIASCSSKQANTSKTVPKATSEQELDPRIDSPLRGVDSEYVPGRLIKNTSGHSRITVKHSGELAPIYARLWTVGSGARPVRTFTVSAIGSFTLKDLTPGTYEIRYKYMYENDAATSGFKSTPFTLSETETSEGIEYDNLIITLSTVATGKIRVQPIPASDV